MNKNAVIDAINKTRTEFLQIIKMVINNEDDDIVKDSHELSNSQFNEFHMKDAIHINLMFEMIKLIINEFDKTITKSEFYDKLKEGFHTGTKNELWSAAIIDLITDRVFKDKHVEIESDSELNSSGTHSDVFELDDDIEETCDNISWREHQERALNAIGMVCGIIFHIMGAGKTFIMLKDIYNDFLKQGKKVNGYIYVITCPKQEILKQLFFNKDGKIDKNKSKFFRHNDIIDLNKFNVVSKVHNKTPKLIVPKDKPTLLVINTDFLKSMNIKETIKFSSVRKVYFDECHGVSAGKFYKLLKKIKYEHKIPIIGFSATPLRNKADDKLVDIFSETYDKDSVKKLNIIDSYDMFSAIKDNIILPPYHVLCEVNKTVNNKIGKTNKDILKKIIADTIKNKEVPYKKFVGWCRNIAQMEEFYKYIKKEFPALKMYCTSYKDSQMKQFNTNYDKFIQDKGNAFLLCVNRVREGSDIQYLDTAMYLDGVRKRSNLVSLQTMGRVLRPDKEGLKVNGHIIDTYTNETNISVEAMTAEKIIEYYQNIYSLCDISKENSNVAKYDELKKLCNSIEYDEDKEEIKIKIDDNDKHDIKFKLYPITFTKKSYDFSKLKDHLKVISDKIVKLDIYDKYIVFKNQLKNNNVKDKHDYNKNWKKYKIYDENKEKIEPDKHYSDYFKNWYDLLDINISKYPKDKQKWINVCNKHKIDGSNYFKNCHKYNLPSMPEDLYQDFTSINLELVTISKKLVRKYKNISLS